MQAGSRQFTRRKQRPSRSAGPEVRHAGPRRDPPIRCWLAFLVRGQGKAVGLALLGLRRPGRPPHNLGRLDRRPQARDVLPGREDRSRRIAGRGPARGRPARLARRGITRCARDAAHAREVAVAVTGVAAVGRVAMELAPIDFPTPLPAPTGRTEDSEDSSQQATAAVAAARSVMIRGTARVVRSKRRAATGFDHRPTGLDARRLTRRGTARLTRCRATRLAGGATAGREPRAISRAGDPDAGMGTMRGIALGARAERTAKEPVQQRPTAPGIGHQRPAGQEGKKDPFHEFGSLESGGSTRPPRAARAPGPAAVRSR